MRRRLLLRGAVAAVATISSQALELPVPGVYRLAALGHPGLFVRHCDFQAFATPPPNTTEDQTQLGDFQLFMRPALNNVESAVSIQVLNYADHFLVPTRQNPDPGVIGRLGVDTTPDIDDASWLVVPGLADPTLISLQTLSANPKFSGMYMTLASSLTGSCAGQFAPPAGDVYLSEAGDLVAQTWQMVPIDTPPPVNITVQATNLTHSINPQFMGCHSDVRIDALRQQCGREAGTLPPPGISCPSQLPH